MAKKVTFKQWEAAVREARTYISRYDKTRWKIVEIALSVCDQSHGGRKTDSVFSITKFAEAIELNRKTLYEWIAVKTNVLDKLPVKIQEKAASIPYETFRCVRENVKAESTPSEVLGEWMRYNEINPENLKWIKYDKTMRSILYNASRPMLMCNVDLALIEAVIKDCDAIGALLRKEIELRNKFSADERFANTNAKIASAIKDATGEQYEP